MMKFFFVLAITFVLDVGAAFTPDSLETISTTLARPVRHTDEPVHVTEERNTLTLTPSLMRRLDLTSRNIYYEHQTNTNEPTSGFSVMRLKSDPQAMIIQLDGRRIQGFGHLSFTPEAPSLKHHIRLVDLEHDDVLKLSYPVVDIFMRDGSNDQVVKQKVVMKKNFYDTHEGKNYEPIKYKEVNSEYVPDEASLVSPKAKTDFFQVRLYKKTIYRRPILQDSGSGKSVFFGLPNDSIYEHIDIPNDVTLVTLTAKHKGFAHYSDKRSSQEVVLYCPKDPTVPNSELVQFRGGKVFTLGFYIEHKEEFLRYEYNDKKREDTEVLGYFLDPLQVFPAQGLPPKDQAKNMIPVQENNKNLETRGEPQKYRLEKHNRFKKNVYHARGPGKEDKNFKKLFWS